VQCAISPEVIRLNPSNAQAYVNRGVARHSLGYHEAAIADLEKAAEWFGNLKQKRCLPKNSRFT
jgi:tetratricopeptide (TPR) repeat protein